MRLCSHTSPESESPNIESVKSNKYVLNAAHYPNASASPVTNLKTIKMGNLFEKSGGERVGKLKNIPIMSITMHDGLIDQADKFNKRIASRDISNYKKVYRNELVVGFPIDEGVLGFQTKYQYAAVSPAYKVWKLKRNDIDVQVIEMILRSKKMREVYQSKMQGSVDRRRSIPDDIFLEMEIPLPPEGVMKEIANQHQEITQAKQKLKDWNNQMQKTIESLWE